MMLLKPDVRGLVNEGDTRVLIRATSHWSGKVRAEAAAALGALRTEDAVPQLLRLLTDGQTEVREAAARALGDIGHSDAAEPLIEALQALKDAKDSKEYESEAIAEALGRLNRPKGVAAVVEAGTERAHEGFFNVSCPCIGGLCLSGSTEARAALVHMAEEHYSYDTRALVVVTEALDYLHEPLATAPLINIVRACVEVLRQSWSQSNDPVAHRNRHVAVAAVAAARALGRLTAKRAEPVLIELLLHLPPHAFSAERRSDKASPDAAREFTDVQDAILTIRGEKSPMEFDCERSSLPLHDYQARRYLTDIKFGGGKLWAIDTCAAGGFEHPPV